MEPTIQLTVTIDNQTSYDIEVNSNPQSYVVVNGNQCVTPPLDAKANSIVTAGVYKSTEIDADGVVEGITAYFAPFHIACLAIWFRVLNNQASPNVAKIASVDPTRTIDLALVTDIETRGFASPVQLLFKDPATGANVTLLAKVKITPGGISTATVTISV